MRAVEAGLRGLVARRRSLLCLLGLAAVLIAFYWPAARGQGVFYVGDVFRLNYPLRAAYALGLRQGRVPLWTPAALAGYPILADGQTGAYYPPNLLLYRLLPVPAALNCSILLSYWIAGAGLFLYLRALGVRRWPAALGGCILMLGGFLPAHLNHVNMLAAASWLPLLLWTVERAARSVAWRAWVPVAVVCGLQGLAGHPQVLVLSGALALAQALVGPLAGPRPPFRRWQQATPPLRCAVALAAGAALATVQLLPTFELMRLSQRGQTATYEFFTTFSMLPAELLTMLWPFARGNPYPLVSPEIVGYVGALPVVLAAVAPLRRWNRATAFWAAVAVLGTVLALGRFGPLYGLLWQIPVVNRFRAPARYLLWLDLALAVLAAIALDALRPHPQRGAALRWASLLALPLVAVPGLWLARVPLEALLLHWRWLPLLWLGGAGALLAALHWRPPAALWLTLVTALVLADLGAFTGVYGRTYNDLLPRAEFERTPEAVAFLPAEGQEPYRVYTDERVHPNLAVMRESLYPNIQLLHGAQSANGYFPLVPGPQEWLLGHLTPRLADLLGVRYILVPQELPSEGPQDLFIGGDPLAPNLAGRRFELPAQLVAAVEVEGFTLHCADLRPGTPLGQVVLHGARGEEVVWPLRAGVELEECTGAAAGGEAPAVARTWPLRFDLPGGQGLGYTYRARWALPEALQVWRVEVRAAVPAERLRLERLRLVAPDGRAQRLPVGESQGDHELVYCSPGVAIYRNPAAGPRAFLVHRARVVATEGEARRIVAGPGFSPHGEVILLEGRPLAGRSSPGDRATLEVYGAEYVRVRAVTAAEGYLVLADSFYPGWSARVDGRPAPLLRADVALRAVALAPGEHVVEFAYRPESWRLGGLVSGLTGLALAALWAAPAVARWRRPTSGPAGLR